MKVRGVNNTEIGTQNIRTAENLNGLKDSSVTFSRTLSDLTAEQRHARLTELAGKIEEQGEKLSKKADIKVFERYRQLIREFLDEVVSNGYEFSKENAFGARGRHRFFATVKIIDKNLDEMARDIISGQAEGIDILNRIDDIRGLILDMTL